MINNKIKKQMSDSLLLSAMVSFSAGLQDAYTYNVREHVFANAQTGNIVLCSQYFMLNDICKGFRYLLPIFSFAIGTWFATSIEFKYKKMKILHWRQIIIFIEFIVLFLVGFISLQYNPLANAMVSFACAMQLQSFRTVNGNHYASTMCIGNLKSGTSNFVTFFLEKDNKFLFKALHYFGMILIFAIGAGLGGVLSFAFGIRTIWISSIVLFICFILLMKKSY